MLIRASIFLAIFAVLQSAWQSQGGGATRHLLIDEGIVVPAVHLVHLLTPRLEAKAAGNQLWEPQGGLNIVNGCDGTETLWLLIAAFLVAPISLKARISGILVGFTLVYAVNMARILSLFYAHHTSAQLFDFLHGVLTPVLMVLSVAAFYYFWLHGQQRAAATR